MIFWFSGTGNSYAVAKALAEGLGEWMMPVSRALEQVSDIRPQLDHEKRIGFVYPIYAWGPPKMVRTFVNRLQLGELRNGKMPYLFSVSTCGDEEGRSTDMLQRDLSKEGVALDSAFTLRMPNNYVIGFDVDSPQVQQDKLREADLRITEMLPVLKACTPGVFELLPGKAADLKTRIVNPLFNRYAMDATRFSATDACTKCGLCEDLCPARNIIRNEGRPVWGNRCTQCLACLHQCPVAAVQYGKGTVRKGRYIHPEAKGMRMAMKA